MNRPTESSAAWDYLLDELAPDIALLQEVIAFPKRIADRIVAHRATWKDGTSQTFSTAVLAGPGACTPNALRSETTWVDTELAGFAGNVLSTRVHLGAADLHVVSVHSPAWCIPEARLNGMDTTGVRLTLQDRDVWVADLLCAAVPKHTIAPWIVGGDFNLSETFDERPGGPRGNREYLDRMANAGYTECLREKAGHPVTTFKPRGPVGHQIDHLFVSRPLAKRLLGCEVGATELIWDNALSDHLPIIADFEEVTGEGGDNKLIGALPRSPAGPDTRLPAR